MESRLVRTVSATPCIIDLRFTTALEQLVSNCHCWRFRCCRTWRTIHRRPALTLFSRQVTRTLTNVFCVLCHKVKFIDETEHFPLLFEDEASRKRQVPTFRSCPAGLAVSDLELLLPKETKTRMQTEATSSSHRTSDTLAAGESKLELQLEDAVERMASNCGKGIGLRFQGAHAPSTAKHAECKALTSHQQKAQFRRAGVLGQSINELRTLKQKKPTAKATKVWTRRWASTCVSVRWWRSSATRTTQRRDPTRKCLRLKVRPDGRFIGVMECMINAKECFYLRRQPETVCAVKRALYSAESPRV